jgi:hypothetical protein
MKKTTKKTAAAAETKTAAKGKKPAKKAAAGAQKPAAAPADAPTTKEATKPKGAAKGAKAAKTTGVPREFSKSAIITGLVTRKGGATLAELLAATGWQKHSVRGFLSTLGKKIDIVSTKTEAGERNYASKG